MASNIMEYITDALSDIEDSGKRKEALLSIVGTLYDKKIIDFKDNKAGYIDDLEGNLEKHKAQIDEIINNNEIIKAQRADETVTLRGLYELALYPIDNATKQVFDGMKLEITNKVKVVSAKKSPDRKDKFAYIVLREIEKIDKLLGADDRQTYVAIANLLYNGKRKVTPRQLYCYAVHDVNARPTEEQLKRQHESIVRLAKLYIELDTKEIIELYPELDKVIKGGQFIKVKQWYGKTASGGFNEYYEFDGVPLLFDFAVTIKQVVKIENTDKALLESPLRKTAENTAIIQCIADRVTALRNNHEVKCLISYDTIFRKAGINFSKYKTKQGQYKKKSTTKKAIITHLEHLKQAGKITGYDEMPTGIEISV